MERRGARWTEIRGDAARSQQLAPAAIGEPEPGDPAARRDELDALVPNEARKEHADAVLEAGVGEMGAGGLGRYPAYCSSSSLSPRAAMRRATRRSVAAPHRQSTPPQPVKYSPGSRWHVASLGRPLLGLCASRRLAREQSCVRRRKVARPVERAQRISPIQRTPELPSPSHRKCEPSSTVTRASVRCRSACSLRISFVQPHSWSKTAICRWTTRAA